MEPSNPTPPSGAAPSLKKKKKKEEDSQYSSGTLFRLHKFEKGVTKAQHRMAKAIELGLATWREESDRSSRRKKDGAIKDAFQNVADAVSKTMREMSDVPKDVIDTVNPRIKPKMWVSLFVPPQLR